MFEELRQKTMDFFSGIQEKTDALTTSVQEAHTDLTQLLDIFVSIKNLIASLIGFMGKETLILFFCTLIFLFILNLIPFFFFEKKSRYYTGIGFGVVLGMWLSYSFVGVSKYVLIMLLPVFAERAIVFISKKTTSFLSNAFKKGAVLSWNSLRRLFSKTALLLKKNETKEKTPDDSTKQIENK